jgi:hypothetical protein
LEKVENNENILKITGVLVVMSMFTSCVAYDNGDIIRPRKFRRDRLKRYMEEAQRLCSGTS